MVWRVLVCHACIFTIELIYVKYKVKAEHRTTSKNVAKFHIQSIKCMGIWINNSTNAVRANEWIEMKMLIGERWSEN